MAGAAGVAAGSRHKRPKDHLMVMNLCGRGDKDIFAVADHLGGM
jgi:tryptophan synthase beta subunit